MIDMTTSYARDVVEGKVAVFAYAKTPKLCHRHIEQLENGASRGLVWDADFIERLVRFCRDVLTVDGKPLILQPEQVFLLGMAFGWKEAQP